MMLETDLGMSQVGYLTQFGRGRAGSWPSVHRKSTQIRYLPVETSLPVFRSQRTVRTGRRCSPWQVVHTRFFASVARGDFSRKRLITALRLRRRGLRGIGRTRSRSTSAGNMTSGGMMFASSLRCAIDGPWHDEQPTAFDACVAARSSFRKLAWQTRHELLSANFFDVRLRGGLFHGVEPEWFRVVELQRRRLRGSGPHCGCRLAVWLVPGIRHRLLRPTRGPSIRIARERPRQYRIDEKGFVKQKACRCLRRGQFQPHAASPCDIAQCLITHIPSRGASGSRAASRPRRDSWRA